jgi:hypothetical protein
MLEDRFGGSAAEKAKTYEGVVARLKITLGELQESIGYKVLPILTRLGESAVRISEAFGLGGAAGGVKQLRLEIVNLGTDADVMINTFGKIYNSIAGLVNGIMNALAIPLATLHFLRTGDLGNYKVKGLPTFEQLMAQNPTSNRPVSTQQAESMFNVPSGASAIAGTTPASIPRLPSKKSTAPPTGLGGGNGGTEFGLGNISFTDMPLPPMTINIDAGLISSPATVGQDIIDAILAAQRDSGAVFAPASGL